MMGETVFVSINDEAKRQKKTQGSLRDLFFLKNGSDVLFDSVGLNRVFLLSVKLSVTH